MFGNMAPETSTYQAFKIWFQSYVPVERDVLHYLIGALLVLVALVIAKGGGRYLLAAFIVALLLAFGMEALDARDDLATLGYWRWWAAGLDVLRTIAVPALALSIRLVQTRERAT